ncbi:trans-acting enoyl reductase family protein [Angustibacter sp. Root456]|uniref:saccharopine dehydrogenase family protein n=1 Tax=Angustibacter sp. Root456 TaxID=1736539 RepID=UPI0006F682AD|nr:saccharopine dehydrogenase NADP-binding domain-containing protein [Angustibacter sp. Root456]KQX66001.1 enoyl-ACP reductase [Angustibacter sp. Root456]
MSADRDHARELDVVVYGATGFVGRLVAQHLADHAPDGLRIALGGRSLERLEGVRRGLGERASGWPLLVADSADRAALDGLAARTRVVATTVGPYARYGLPLAEACAAAGTHYADLTGEVLFVRDCIDACDEAARATGARIVNACGYDSIPSDLAVLQLHERVVADGAGELAHCTLVATAKGGFSGGTIDSARAQVDAVQRDPRRRRVLVDPYALSPDRAAEPDLGDERDTFDVFRNDTLGGWLGPFVMASFNTRIVRRSNALQHWAYGRGFRYRELSAYGRGTAARATATAVTIGLGLGLKALASKRLRPLVDRLLPAPGEGPSDDQRAAGRFRMRVHATTTTGARYVSTVAAQGDPGYAATAVMLGEAAVALAVGEGLPSASGVLTPATGIGMALADRLRERGFELSVSR